MRAPAPRCTVDSGPSAPRRATRPRRVASPSAANNGAAAPRPALAALARRDMTRDVLHLLGPAAVVHAERLGAARRRDAVEARFDDAEERTLVGVLEAEL